MLILIVGMPAVWFHIVLLINLNAAVLILLRSFLKRERVKLMDVKPYSSITFTDEEVTKECKVLPVNCPECGSPCRVMKSSDRLFRANDYYVECTNPNCRAYRHYGTAAYHAVNVHNHNAFCQYVSNTIMDIPKLITSNPSAITREQSLHMYELLVKLFDEKVKKEEWRDGIPPHHEADGVNDTLVAMANLISDINGGSIVLNPTQWGKENIIIKT